MMKKIKTFVLASMILSSNFGYAQVSVNEVMPCNISTYMDRDLFNFSGYVEFYNNGDTKVDLKGYRIVHEKRTGKGVYSLKWDWTIDQSVVVPAGSYKLILFDQSSVAGHSPYKLDSDGGKIYLYNGSGALVSSITYPAMLPHISYGPEGYMDPSPLKVNTSGVSSISASRCEQPSFSGTQPGIISNAGSVELTCATSGATIYYTTDGTEPNKSSKQYSKAISISSNTVIRARAYADGYVSSPILTGSFIFSDSKHSACNGFTVPIVSLVVDDDYFNDDSIGICVKGVNGADITTSCLGTGKANFMQEWERPVSFEYIVDGKQVLSHEAEVGVMGGCSRGYDVKSLKIKAGKKLGSANEVFKYAFFPEKADNKYTSLHLRNGGNAYDASYVRCRDGFMQSIAKVMDVDYQAYEPVAYYINGKYKGLMGLRERTSDDYVESNYGVENDNLDLLKLTNKLGIEAVSGDAQVYNEMISFLEQGNPTSGDYYTQASKYIDMNEYIDYQIFQHFVVNTDWPGNNCKLWREKENGRFRWILFDTDFGLGLYESSSPNYCDVAMNSIEWCMGTGSAVNWANGTKNSSGNYQFDDNSLWKTTLFYHLMQNETFKQKFLNRSLMHLGTTFTAERIQSVWDSLAAKVENEYCASFSYDNDLTSLSAAKSMITFAKNRPSYMYSYMKEFYGLGALVNLEISSNIQDAHLMMNDELLNLASFNGKYYTGKELKLEAIAPLGYVFDHWDLGDGYISTQLLTESSQWKYSYNETGFDDASWAALNYNDTEWNIGYGKMGYASDVSSYNTVLDYGPDETNKYMAAYFRSNFTLESLDGLKNVSISLTYDDAYVLYLNGIEVSRDNIEGEVNGLSSAVTYKNDEQVVIKLDSTYFKYLNVGANTLAVEIHQDKATSSDLTLNLTMNANYEGGSTGVMSEPILTTTLTESKVIKAVFKESTSCPYLPLLISEVAPSNGDESEIVDEYGNRPDWFEIYNNGDETINLAGLYLTDDFGEPTKSQIPYGYEDTKLEPGEHFVFWADNKSFRGVHHVNFKLSNTKSESSLYLIKGCDESNPIDAVTYEPMNQNSSYGRVDDNSESWVVYNSECDGTNSIEFLPTPGAKNGSLSVSCESETTDNKIVSPIVAYVYPNPAQDVLNITVSDATNLDVVILDQLGCQRISLESANTNETQLNVASLPTGIYILQVTVDNTTYRQSFLKK